ncbi:MAG: NAD(P)-dependent oxidoreductase [Flavobacteriales bacterium]|nr:NAD(P)-dependent oxidoreductase [Flavobacteriales bacterium]
MSLKGKTVIISGGSRGIGKAIALKLASQGANIAIAAKTAEPHPKLEGTIFSAVEDIIKAGGNGLAIQCDVREDEQVENAIAKTVETFGGIDIVINNASAINLSPSSTLQMKSYDLMMDINVRGTYLLTKSALPHLKQSSHAHILTLSPPLNLDPKWFSRHMAYTMAKYGMSMAALGFSQEYKKFNIASNALWPRTTIATAAIQNIVGGEEMMKISRKPEIMADAALEILKRNPQTCNGNFFIDEEVLRESGISDFSNYAVDPKAQLMTDLFL